MTDQDFKKARESVADITKEIKLLQAEQAQIIQRLERLEIMTCDGETPEGRPGRGKQN